MPSAEALQAHYQDPSYFAGEAEQGYRCYEDMRQALWPHFRRRLAIIDRLVPDRGRLLDFGCAAGYFLELAQADGRGDAGGRGWQVSGVELAQDMARATSARLGAPVARTLAALPGQVYDVVTLWDTVEHLPQPVETLHALCGRLRGGGLLMLSTPNAGHWQAVREPECWASYRPPSHLLFFTARTLEDTLQRAGFERIIVSKMSPLPPLPGWLRRLTAPLERALATGQARPWRLALLTWRAVRLCGWSWQKLAHRDDDIYAVLEATAFRPAQDEGL
jgi:2-polyprenyl-3-methyl-5-hydroxy-6-metoxy-1,4-benzoquinol methylase